MLDNADFTDLELVYLLLVYDHDHFFLICIGGSVNGVSYRVYGLSDGVDGVLIPISFVKSHLRFPLIHF